MASQLTRAEFEAVLPSIIQELIEQAKQFNTPANALELYEKSLNCNLRGGKLTRGMSVVDTGRALLGSLTDQQFKDLATLGWLVELLQAFFLVSDDIMDNSITRRGEPCWYRREGIGMMAINDSFLLESSIYVILKKHFRSHPAYVDLIELFHDITLRTEFGQSCDLLTAPEDDVDLNRFDLKKYSFIVRYKTAYYSTYLSVALALHYLQLATTQNLKQSHELLMMLGEYFQIQDDYLDVYGDPKHIGKIGTDIQDNKCSWVINQALLRCSPEQRKTLDESYGRKDKALEAKAKAVFDELNMAQFYHDWEEEHVKNIKTSISAVDESEGLKRKAFEIFLAKLYKRDK